MGVLSDIVSVDIGHGDINVEVLRRSTSTSVCSLHRWIHLVLFYLYHHPRPCRHLDGKSLRFPPIYLRPFSILFQSSSLIQPQRDIVLNFDCNFELGITLN